MTIKKTLLWVALPFFCAATARAGVFNTVHFVEPGKMAVGLEPELTLTDGAGLAVNAKFTQGVSDFMDAAAIVGTGGGPRRFRLGGDLVFDVFPDVDKQPGIGILARGIYYRVPNSGQFDLTGAPYIHKAFLTGEGNKDEIEPFVAVPLGMAFDSGTYQWIGQIVIGSMFKNASTEKFRYSFEMGINLNNSESYLSGGITYYP
jgi:hypothetical protein